MVKQKMRLGPIVNLGGNSSFNFKLVLFITRSNEDVILIKTCIGLMTVASEGETVTTVSTLTMHGL